MNLELNIPRENLKESLRRLVDGPNSSDYPTVSEWSCNFISFENFYIKSFSDRNQFFISFDEYFDYLEKSVYEQSWSIGKNGIDFYDDNRTGSILCISYVDVKTSQPRSLLLSFFGCAQPYWRTNFRLATFQLEASNHPYQLLANENIGPTLFVLEALDVTFGGRNDGPFSTQRQWIKEALKTDKNHLSYEYLSWQKFSCYYTQSLLIVGNRLVDYLGVEKLRSAPAFAMWERPNSLFLFSSPNNFYKLDRRYKKCILDLENYYGGKISKSAKAAFEEEGSYYNDNDIYWITIGIVGVPGHFNEVIDPFEIKLIIEEDDY